MTSPLRFSTAQFYTSLETLQLDDAIVRREVAWILEEECGSFHSPGDRERDCPGCREFLAHGRRACPDYGTPEHWEQVERVFSELRTAKWSRAVKGRRYSKAAEQNNVMAELDRALGPYLADKTMSRVAIAEARRKILDGHPNRKRWAVV